MATQSFFEDLVLDTKEKAFKLEMAFEEADAKSPFQREDCSKALEIGKQFLQRRRSD